MEDTTIIERDISSVRNQIRSEQSQLNREPIGPPNPVIQAELNSDKQTLRTLEQKEEREKSYEQAHGFGY